MPEVAVRDVPAEERFVVEVDGEVAGFTVYHNRNGRYFFVHTEIEKEFAGMGLAKILVRSALDSVRESGGSVIPICPYVNGFIQRNAEYEDLINHEIFDRIANRLHEDSA